MHSFRTVLTAGKKRPYDSWTFLVIPSDVASKWGAGQHVVRGTINGHAFVGTASRGEGVVRVPIAVAFRESSGVACGDVVEVVIARDAKPPRLHIPVELKQLLDADVTLVAQFDALPPSMRRAWAQYVGEAKRSDTRAQRAQRAPEGIRKRAYPR